MHAGRTGREGNPAVVFDEVEFVIKETVHSGSITEFPRSVPILRFGFSIH
jgi:hypothetical protein